MKANTIITWGILIILTLISANTSKQENAYVILTILALMALKFFGIAFQYMELKNAHMFWKLMIIMFIVFFGLGFLLVAF